MAVANDTARGIEDAGNLRETEETERKRKVMWCCYPQLLIKQKILAARFYFI